MAVRDKPAPRPVRMKPGAARATEFQWLAEGLRTEALQRILGVSRTMIGRYRRLGAPAKKIALLRTYLEERAKRLA